MTVGPSRVSDVLCHHIGFAMRPQPVSPLSPSPPSPSPPAWRDRLRQINHSPSLLCDAPIDRRVKEQLVRGALLIATGRSSDVCPSPCPGSSSLSLPPLGLLPALAAHTTLPCLPSSPSPVPLHSSSGWYSPPRPLQRSNDSTYSTRVRDAGPVPKVYTHHPSSLPCHVVESAPVSLGRTAREDHHAQINTCARVHPVGVCTLTFALSFCLRHAWVFLAFCAHALDPVCVPPSPSHRLACLTSLAALPDLPLSVLAAPLLVSTDLPTPLRGTSLPLPAGLQDAFMRACGIRVRGIGMSVTKFGAFGRAVGLANGRTISQADMDSLFRDVMKHRPGRPLARACTHAAAITL